MRGRRSAKQLAQPSSMVWTFSMQNLPAVFGRDCGVGASDAAVAAADADGTSCSGSTAAEEAFDSAAATDGDVGSWDGTGDVGSPPFTDSISRS